MGLVHKFKELNIPLQDIRNFTIESLVNKAINKRCEVIHIYSYTGKPVFEGTPYDWGEWVIQAYEKRKNANAMKILHTIYYDVNIHKGQLYIRLKKGYTKKENQIDD